MRPRAFIATRQNEALCRLFESLKAEAIPLTLYDSVIDNIESLHTCTIVIVDDSAPSWVLREVKDKSLFCVAFGSAPEGEPVVCLFYSLDDVRAEYQTLVELGRGAPVTEQFVLSLAELKKKYPLYERSK